jgi:hypothetical protein
LLPIHSLRLRVSGSFDRHRTGVHAYTFLEGLDLDPPREDGRRCLDPDDMREAGMELDARGRWCIVAEAERVRRAFEKRSSMPSLSFGECAGAPENPQEESEAA